MPIWPVSFKDGSFQVADADGHYYPITQFASPLTTFLPGWKPVGLQTGLPPFYILELSHTDGHEAFWLLDPALDYVSNQVNSLPQAERLRFAEHLEPLIRNLFEDAVRASHAAVPAAAHAFDGFRDSTILGLIGPLLATVPGRPEIVSLAGIEALAAPYSHAGITLSPGRIRQTLQAPLDLDIARPVLPSPLDGSPMSVQERFALPSLLALRFLDTASGLVFYVIAATGSADRYLYLPRTGVLFTSGEVAQAPDLLGLLLTYYATHVDRAVMLPEMEGLEPGLVHVVPPKPQPGLDEPAPAAPEVAAPPKAAEPAKTDEAAWLRAAHVPPRRAVPEAPAPSPSEEAGADGVEARSPRSDAERDLYEQPVLRQARSGPDAPAEAPRRQNWWQRLLGLGAP